jgi:hypothetical protein
VELVKEERLEKTEYMGVAFQDKNLISGPLYMAVASTGDSIDYEVESNGIPRFLLSMMNE